jgi:hypothetical protein
MLDDQTRDPQEMALLTAYLAERDVPCPRCGYNLHGLINGRCPECGDDLRLRVTPVEPRLGAFITLLLACGIGLGGSALFGALALAYAPGGWFKSLSGLGLLVQLGLSAVVALLVLLRRRRFRKVRRKVQWVLAIAACLVFAALSTLIVAFFRG